MLHRSIYTAIFTALANSAHNIMHGANPFGLIAMHQSNDAADEGKKHLSAGDLAAAEKDFLKSVTLNHINPEALVALAQTLDQEGKEKQAIDVYRYLLYPKPDRVTSDEGDTLLRMRFARLLARNGSWDEAVAIYEGTIGGISISSTFPVWTIHFNPGQPQQALFLSEVHLATGIIMSGRGKNPQALSEFTEALKTQPESAVATFYYGWGLFRLGRRSEANEAYTTAQRLRDSAMQEAAQTQIDYL